MSVGARLRRAVDIRQGETRTLAVMAGFLFLNTANTTVLSAAKNGLFLSEYPADLIPVAVIAAALLTATVAIIFTGVIAGTARRILAVWLTVMLGLSVIACWVMFRIDARSAFVVYLWLSAVQVLVLTHAWDYAGDLMTGRQAKRLLPLIGMGASVGAIAGGLSVPFAAQGLGTENLLWIAMGLLGAALPLLWLTREPGADDDEPMVQPGSVTAFASRAAQGMKAVGQHRLLRLLAVGLIALTLTGTLIDLQLKFLLNREGFARDDITTIYGLMSAAVGLGTLLLQLWASRVLFPRFGVSSAAVLHGGTLLLAAGGTALFGTLVALVVAQALDDILQFSLQKPVEQVSLLPYPGRVKNVALATLEGVLRPLSKASGGGIALALASRPMWLPIATIASATVALVTYTQHRRRYMAALEAALARHAVDFSTLDNLPLVVDAGTVEIIDRGLADDDPGVVIFSASLLEQLPLEEALPRLTTLLGHDVPEVRAEAAMVFSRIDAPLDFATGVAVAHRLADEEVPFVIGALLDTIGTIGGVEPEGVERFLDHEDADVRRAALVALGKLGWEHTHARALELLRSDRAVDRSIGAGAVGDLRAVELKEALGEVLVDGESRATVLEALIKLGEDAVPIMTDVLGRTELPVPMRRTVVSALAAVGGTSAREALLDRIEDPALGPAALTSLARLRSADRIDPVRPELVHGVLLAEMQRGLRLSAMASIIRNRAEGPRDSFIALELQGLHERSVHRVLRILGLSYDASRIGRIASALISDDPARRSNSLELLEGTISTAAAKTVMPYMDVVAEGMPLNRVVELLENPAPIQQSPAEALLEEPEWWPRALGLHMLGRDEDIATPGLSELVQSEEGDVIPLIEKVMLLKGSEFFRNFPGADLAGIASLAGVVHVEDGEVIFEQGDEGDAFYLVVKGAVVISRGTTKLATLGPREGFGEMSILDRETRSATATAEQDTTLLSLDRDSFDQIIEQNPAVARGVYRVLTERLRNTLAQVAAG